MFDYFEGDVFKKLSIKFYIIYYSLIKILTLFLNNRMDNENQMTLNRITLPTLRNTEWISILMPRTNKKIGS